MSEKILSEVIIESGFKAEWFNKDQTIARIDYTSGKACYVPFPWLQRIFRNDRKLLISTVLPSGKCAILFSESLKEDIYFLPFLRDAIGEDTNLKNIADEFPWKEYLTVEHPDKKGDVLRPIDPRFQFKLINPSKNNKYVCSVIALTYLDKIKVKFFQD